MLLIIASDTIFPVFLIFSYGITFSSKLNSPKSPLAFTVMICVLIDESDIILRFVLSKPKPDKATVAEILTF